MRNNAVIAAALALMLAACGSAGKTGAAGPSGGQIPASNARHVSAAGADGNALPVLPQQNGAGFGPAVPGGLTAHGPYSRTDVTYAGNLGAAPQLSTAAVLQRLRLSTSGPLSVQNVAVKRFGDVDAIAKGRLSLLTVSPDRIVYEVTTSFSAPYTIRGNTWSSGTRTFVVDAQTGDVLLGQTDGALVHSMHIDLLHRTQAPPNSMRQLPPPSVLAPGTAATTAPAR